MMSPIRKRIYMRIYMRVWRKRNPAKVRVANAVERKRRRRKDIRERNRIVSRAWRKKNVECTRFAKRRWRQRNPEKSRAITVRWRKRNSARVRATVNARNKRHCSSLSDIYIKKRLGLPQSAPTASLIGAYREVLRVKRLLRSMQ